MRAQLAQVKRAAQGGDRDRRRGGVSTLRLLPERLRLLRLRLRLPFLRLLHSREPLVQLLRFAQPRRLHRACSRFLSQGLQMCWRGGIEWQTPHQTEEPLGQRVQTPLGPPQSRQPSPQTLSCPRTRRQSPTFSTASSASRRSSTGDWLSPPAGLAVTAVPPSPPHGWGRPTAADVGGGSGSTASELPLPV